jgi:hypothetical protein
MRVAFVIRFLAAIFVVTICDICDTATCAREMAG